MTKKGFVLMETIIVIVVISVSLLTLFSSYNKIMSKAKIENKYDTSEYIYITKWIKDYLKTLSDSGIVAKDITNKNITNYINKLENDDNNLYGVEKIYIIKNINNFAENESKFDAYMIDYIKKLDVSDDESLIIVEYKKPVRDINNYENENKDYKTLEDTTGKELYETFIASLRWEYDKK